MSVKPVTAFAGIAETVSQLAEAVTGEEWAAATPCRDWTVRELVDHLLAGQRTFVVVMTDQQRAGEDTFRVSAARLVSAFDQPGALQRTVQAPIGAVPGAVALHLQTIEHLVHGWDLAWATGRKLLVDEGVVEGEIEFAESMVAQLPAGPGGPFAAPRLAPAGAPAIDRLAALLGRSVTR